jgi:hypothetical protein
MNVLVRNLDKLFLNSMLLVLKKDFLINFPYLLDYPTRNKKKKIYLKKRINNLLLNMSSNLIQSIKLTLIGCKESERFKRFLFRIGVNTSFTNKFFFFNTK